MMYPFRHSFLTIAFFLFFHSYHVTANNTGPLIWDMNELEKIKTAPSLPESAKKIIRAAKRYCKLSPVIITDKQKSFAPDNHYYCSIGPYWWPDSIHPGNYYRRDGVVNPESSLYDNSKLVELTRRCQKLSIAYYLTGNVKYYQVFISQIKAWFINEDTYMYPNFEYDLPYPPQSKSESINCGIIGSYKFNHIIESIRLVDSVTAIDKETMIAIQEWFLEFTKWAEKKHGSAMHKGKQNISIAYDVTMVNMHLFVGDTIKAKKIADNFAKKRILVQIKEDGSQPAELRRTKGFFYSIYNLKHILDFCYLARNWDNNYYNTYAFRIDKAFDFLQKYSKTPETFPYQQITGWDDCIKMLDEQLQRRNNLKKT